MYPLKFFSGVARGEQRGATLYHCELERLILMSSLLHRWTGKVLCHSEKIETAVSTDLTSAGTV